MPVVLGTGAAVGVFAAHTGLAGSLIALPVLHNLSGLSTHGEVSPAESEPQVPECSKASLAIAYRVCHILQS